MLIACNYLHGSQKVAIAVGPDLKVTCIELNLTWDEARVICAVPVGHQITDPPVFVPQPLRALQMLF